MYHYGVFRVLGLTSSVPPGFRGTNGWFQTPIAIHILMNFLQNLYVSRFWLYFPMLPKTAYNWTCQPETVINRLPYHQIRDAQASTQSSEYNTTFPNMSNYMNYMKLEIHIHHRIIFPINPLKFPWAEDKHGHLRSKGRGWPPPTATAQGFLGLKILPSTKWCRVLSIHSMFVRVCQDPEVTRNSCTSEKGLVPQLIGPLIMHFCTPIKCNKSSPIFGTNDNTDVNDTPE